MSNITCCALIAEKAEEYGVAFTYNVGASSAVHVRIYAHGALRFYAMTMHQCTGAKRNQAAKLFSKM